MLTTGNLRDPDFDALVREAMATDNQLALDVLYTTHVFAEQYAEWWFDHGGTASTTIAFPLENVD